MTPVLGTSLYQSVSILCSHHLARSSAVLPLQTEVGNVVFVAAIDVVLSARVLVCNAGIAFVTAARQKTENKNFIVQNS